MILLLKLPPRTGVNVIQVYPNPFENELVVSVKNPVDPSLQVQMYDELGQRVLNTTLSLTEADALFTLPIMPLAHGVYFLRIDGNTTKFKQELVK